MAYEKSDLRFNFVSEILSTSDTDSLTSQKRVDICVSAFNYQADLDIWAALEVILVHIFILKYYVKLTQELNIHLCSKEENTVTKNICQLINIFLRLKNVRTVRVQSTDMIIVFG